ncbi:glycosyltransferase family 4 protein [Thermanaerothrix sp.]
MDLRHVAVVYRLDRPGGVQSVAFALIRGLNRRGIVPTILWDVPPNPSLLQRQQCQAKFEKVRFPVPTLWIDRLPNTLRYLTWIFNTIRYEGMERKYRFAFLFHNGFLVPPGMPHVRYLSGPPLLPQLEQSGRGLRGLPMRMLRAGYQRVLSKRWPAYEYHRQDCYVINSRYTAGLFYQAHGVELPVVYPPINLEEWHFDPGDWSQRDCVTFFSRIVDYKRPNWIFRLAKVYPQWHYLIMGGVPPHRIPYLRSLQAQAERMGIAHRVSFLPNPSYAEVKEALARTRFYVFPAVNEHFGMTTVEAIAMGAIPFVHDSGGQREIVPLDWLRFSDETFVERFDGITLMSQDELECVRQGIRSHINQFSETIAVGKLLEFMDRSEEAAWVEN